MKRSEMVKLITEELYDILPSELCKHAEDDANRILRRIEEEGMLPPTIKNPEFKDIGKWYQYCQEVAKGRAYGYSVEEKPFELNQWEREDE